ncbi:hypothetical protein AVEN_144538-1 [Araneus ventricosus]|uniref:RNase H type-1 domain-containing protein n=1 Tax=Araneus ventricosus TaxID=182803 RepID=A0A4Y2IV63_ARAVE|nr:hypothetical protein AVEN_144538-1 [Araneus ventricosus]
MGLNLAMKKLITWPKIGYAVIGLFFCITFTTNFAITYEYNVVAGLGKIIEQAHSFGDFIFRATDFFDLIYHKPYNRIGPYLIGILLAYYFYKRKQNNAPKLKLVFLATGWIIAASIALTCQFSLFHENFSRVETSFYNALSRSGFACGVAWVIFVCVNGQGEIPLNTRVSELRDKVQDSHFEVYTDGSKVDGGVGFSVCILHGEIQHKIICKKLEPQNTVFQAELATLGEAVDWAIENKKKINIYTDSRSSIEALKSYGSRSKLVISIKNKFCLAEGLVGVAWVKAHVGISGNELADHFDKLASVEGESMDIPFPYSFVKFTLKKKLLED